MSLSFDPNQNYYFFKDNKTIPLVFIHGVGLDHQMWNYQTNYFNNYSTLTYDLLGHGKTPCNKDKLSFSLLKKSFSEKTLGKRSFYEENFLGDQIKKTLKYN